MSGLGVGTTGGYSFRFFSPEQVDQILRDGSRRGRSGSHSAIERILKHEPGLERVHLWRRIRQLKNLAPAPGHRRSVWSLEDENILRAGYGQGPSGKQAAVRGLLKLHPGWRPHVVWRRAAKLGLARARSKQVKRVERRPWSENDDLVLLNLAGYKSVKTIGKVLGRTERAVLYRLSVLGKSSRVHKEGYARRALAEELHLGIRTIQRWIVEGMLEVRDPRITKRSLDDLLKSMPELRPTPQACGEEPAAPRQEKTTEFARSPDPAEAGPNGVSPSSTRSSRAKRFWTEAAATAGVSLETVEQHIAKGVLKLCDSRITERSLRNFCRRHGSVINYHFLNEDTRVWLKDSMDLVPSAGGPAARELEPLRRHALVVRRCADCGRNVRGNAFFRHTKRCAGANPRGIGTPLLGDQPRTNQAQRDQSDPSNQSST